MFRDEQQISAGRCPMVRRARWRYPRRWTGELWEQWKRRNAVVIDNAIRTVICANCEVEKRRTRVTDEGAAAVFFPMTMRNGRQHCGSMVIIINGRPEKSRRPRDKRLKKMYVMMLHDQIKESVSPSCGYGARAECAVREICGTAFGGRRVRMPLSVGQKRHRHVVAARGDGDTGPKARKRHRHHGRRYRGKT